MNRVLCDQIWTFHLIKLTQQIKLSKQILNLKFAVNRFERDLFS